MMPEKCGTCGREILVARGPNGRLIPLERALTVYSTRYTVVEWTCEKTPGHHFISHFVTCRHPKYRGMNEPPLQPEMSLPLEPA